jgi:protein-tyrosine phosphatase
MIDVHSHILRAMDDGAATLEESLAMVRLAAECGTTDIVATPHANTRYAFDPELLERCIAELSAASGGVPRIHCGCDFHLSYDNIQRALAEPTRYTINHRSYLLVEFSDLVIFNSTNEVFQQLGAAGMIPVITHPERNALLQQRLEKLAEWTAAGCLLQVTAQSLLGRFGPRAREFALELMRRDLVHVVASDAHDCQDRPPRLDEAYQYVMAKFGEPRARQLFVSNPQALLDGQPLSVPPPERAAPRKWYQFWSA